MSDEDRAPSDSKDFTFPPTMMVTDDPEYPQHVTFTDALGQQYRVHADHIEIVRKRGENIPSQPPSGWIVEHEDYGDMKWQRMPDGKWHAFGRVSGSVFPDHLLVCEWEDLYMEYGIFLRQFPALDPSQLPIFMSRLGETDTLSIRVMDGDIMREVFRAEVTEDLGLRVVDVDQGEFLIPNRHAVDIFAMYFRTMHERSTQE